MLVNPSLFFLTLSACSSFVLAFPSLQARQDEGFKYPLQCRAQCETTDTRILQCRNDLGCLCIDTIITSTAICFSCVASVQPEMTETLQVVLDQVTTTCTNAGLDVTPQIVLTSGDGDENTNVFANIPQTGFRSDLKCKLPCDRFLTDGRCNVGDPDCLPLCVENNVNLLASCFNCMAREEKNSTVTSGLQGVMNAFSDQCTTLGRPLTPATISRGASSNSSSNSSIPGNIQLQDILAKVPETSDRATLKCQLSCGLLAPVLSCDSPECTCTQSNVDAFTACFNCGAREEKNSTVTTGFQGVMNDVVNSCSAAGFNLTAGTISEGASSNSSTSASSSATPVSSSVGSTSASSTVSPTSLSATASASASSLPGNALPAEDDKRNGALSSWRIETSVVVGMGIVMATLLV